MKKFENFKAALVNLNDIFSYKEPYGNCWHGWLI